MGGFFSKPVGREMLARAAERGGKPEMAGNFRKYTGYSTTGQPPSSTTASGNIKEEEEKKKKKRLKTGGVNSILSPSTGKKGTLG